MRDEGEVNEPFDFLFWCGPDWGRVKSRWRMESDRGPAPAEVRCGPFLSLGRERTSWAALPGAYYTAHNT